MSQRARRAREPSSGSTANPRPRYTHSMPLDVNAVVLENRRLSDALQRARSRRAGDCGRVQPGQFVMLKPSHGTDPLLRRPFSVFEVLRNADGAPSGISILNKKTGVGTSLLYDVEPGATIACLGPLGRPFEAGRAAGRSVDGCRRRRAGAVRDAGHRDSSSWARRRRCSTARARPASFTTWSCSSGSASTRCSPRKTAPEARPGGSRRRSPTRCRRVETDAAIRLYVCGPTPMMRAVARLAARAPSAPATSRSNR